MYLFKWLLEGTGRGETLFWEKNLEHLVKSLTFFSSVEFELAQGVFHGSHSKECIINLFIAILTASIMRKTSVMAYYLEIWNQKWQSGSSPKSFPLGDVGKEESDSPALR